MSKSRLFPAMTPTRMTVTAMMARENASRTTRQDEKKGKQLFHTTLTLEKAFVNHSHVRYSKSLAIAEAESFKPDAEQEWAMELSSCPPALRKPLAPHHIESARD